MANTSIYTSITEETVTGARDRVLDALNELTDGKADVAIRYVGEFVELDSILKDIKERKAREAKEAEAASRALERYERDNGAQIFYE